jgi:gamma-glutamyltranspeptidase
MRKLLVSCALLLPLTACKDNLSKQAANERGAIVEAQAGASAAVSEAAQALAAASAPRQRGIADERLALSVMPENYLKATEVKSDDGAARRQSLQLISITVSNTSHFSVADLRGEVTWTDAKGVDIGSSPFSLSGSLLPSETKTFSTSAGTLASPGTVQGVAVRSSVTFRRVVILS